MPEVTTTQHFGPPWDAPNMEPSDDHQVIQVPTPVGQLCTWCQTAIAEGDRGLFHAVAHINESGIHGSAEPIHVECHLRMILGSINHLTNRCSCHGHTEDPAPGNDREEALALLDHINTMRAHCGHGPMW